jgi:hypothetical protein
MVLTEGWDAPWAEVAIIARPTTSPSLYQQMVGRVLRPWPGKGAALVLDVVGAAKMHKLASLIDMSVWTPREDETLLEAEEREELEAMTEEVQRAERLAKGPKWQRDGALTEVDLFAESPSAWLRTRRGVWFINTRATTWFLWEFPDGSYGVATYVNAVYSGKPTMHQTGLPMEFAMSIAENAALKADPSIAARGSDWRTKGAPASEAQLGMMSRWRITAPDGVTKAEASELISIAVATSRIDRYVK